MNYQPIARWKQQLGGLIITLIGGGATVWIWHIYLTEGYFRKFTSMALPASCVLGLALIFFQGYKEERIARGEDISEMKGSELITTRWWVIGALAVVAGAANYVLLSTW